MENLNSKCSSCGYTLLFSPEKQALVCPQCGSVVLIKSGDASDVKKDYNPNSKVERNLNVSSVFECSGCGAKTSINETNVIGTCPYCGSSNVHELANAIEFEPDAIVPFKITKDAACEKYKHWIKTRKFVPNKLKSNAKINKMEGYYLPTWSFDYNVNSTFKGVGVNEHSKTVHERGTDGNMYPVTKRYTTRHPFSGTRFDVFKNKVHTATSQINQHELTKLGNFGLEKLKVYSPEYLLGFASAGLNVDMHLGFENLKHETKQEVESLVKMQYRYDRYERFNLECMFNTITWQFIYLPVWICNFKYTKKEYRFLVNGHTGYVTGKVPRSPFKIGALVLGILAVVGAVVALIAQNV